MKINRTIKLICEIGVINTLRFNFHYLPFRKACKFPILVSRHVRIKSLRGNIVLYENYFKSITIGFDSVSVFDNRKARSIWDVAPKASVIFNGKAKLGNGVKINVTEGGKLIVGKSVVITANSTIICTNNIEIGDNSLLSWDILIMDSDLHKIYNQENQWINEPEKILIGDKVWIGCRSTILKGSKIPSRCVIAAGTLVSKITTIPSCIYGGSPLRILKKDIHWSI